MCLQIIPFKQIIERWLCSVRTPFVNRKVNKFLCTVFLEGNLSLKSSPRADLHKTNVIMVEMNGT